MVQDMQELLGKRTVIERNGYLCGIGTDLEQKPLFDKNYVLSWILRGEGFYEENGVTNLLCDGKVCMRRPGRKYRMQLRQKGGIRLFLTIPMDTYPALCRMLPELDAQPSVWELAIDREHITTFCTLYDHIERCLSTEIYLVLPEMIQYILYMTGIQSRRQREPIQLAERMLSENWTTPLPEIAERCGMCYHTFRKQFAEVYGLSPGQYRIQARIREGCRLLTYGMTVSHTAARLGYTDVYTFTHQFAAVMQCSPARYQKETHAQEETPSISEEHADLT